MAHQFLKILEPSVNKLFFITTNYPKEAIFSPKIFLWNMKWYDGKNRPMPLRILVHILSQLKFSCCLVKIANKVDIIIFVGSTILLLPMLTAYLMRKKTVYINIGPIFVKEICSSYISYFLAFLEHLHHKFSKQVIIYSRNCLTSELMKYKDKISIASRHFLDFDKFRVQKPVHKRGNIVGFIGRFDADKGILNFIKAIPLILEVRKDTSFLIVGRGRLLGRIEEFLVKKNLNYKVKLIRGVSHGEVPKYLNQLKLCVLPSFSTEGLSNIMLEAMACGTPFLTTPTGGILDVIKDGETGFIMKDNSPECIAKNVIRALCHPGLEKIVHNALMLVKNEYTYKAAVEKYRNILNSIIS